MRQSPVVVLALLALVSGAALAADPTTRDAPLVREVKQTELVVKYPGARNREALVILEFDVLAKGKAANITLVDEGFHEERFVKEARRAVAESKWEPRRVNGKPVDSPGMRQTFRFSYTNENGDRPSISEEFATEARKVEELIQRGDFAEGEARANWLIANIVKFQGEYALLQAELAQIYARMGKTAEALDKIWLATARSSGRPNFLQLRDAPPPNDPSRYMLNKSLIVDLLGMRMRLMASRGMALEAMQTYYELAGLQAPAPDDPLVSIANTMTNRIRSSEDLRANIRISPRGLWRQSLSRPHFMLEEVEGKISRMKLNCQAASQELVYRPGQEWTAPSEWGLCTVSILGSTGATFDFVEVADAPDKTSSTP